ncbi:MAG TPA: hypothetical protein VHB72_02210 [Candidatus Saccharimonadales bacterium]|nr:hypothetical protein [Candidatus Saccharimonadales bacterium]
MRYVQKWKTRFSFLAASTLFASLIVTPNVFAASYTWTNQAGSPTAYWDEIGSSSDGKYLAACSWPGYIYTSSDYGATWNQLTVFGHSQWCTTDDVAISADGHYQVVVGSDTVMSDDYGATWTAAYSPGYGVFEAVAMSADGKYLAAATNDYNSPGNGDIWTSSDYGHTWTDQAAPGDHQWSSIVSSSDGSRVIAAAYNGNIYTSSDYGHTWTSQTNAGSQPWYKVVSSANGQYLAATISNYPTPSDIWTSDDYGVTWIDRSSAGTQKWGALTSSSNGQYLAAAAGGNGWTGDVYTSSDYGATWTDQTATAGAPASSALASNATGSRLASVTFNSDIWTAYDPALDPVPVDPVNSSSSNNDASISDPAAPDTGYGLPPQSDPIIHTILSGTLISVSAGVSLLYRKKSKGRR